MTKTPRLGRPPAQGTPAGHKNPTRRRRNVALLAAYNGGASIAQLALREGCSASAISKRLSRARGYPEAAK